MSTLEELKEQASEATQRNIVAKAGGATGEQQWRQLAPVMKYLKDHFTELANALNVLDKGTLVDFKINDSVTLKRLKSQNYKITHPTADKEKDFIFEFENKGEHPSYCLTPVGTAAATFKRFLNDNQIKCVTTPVEGNKSVKFEIKSLVHTKYRFTVDLEKESIGLTISNFSNVWSQTNYLKINEITTDLMDELTHHVMREPNKFNEMVGNTISDEARTELREKLQSDLAAKKAQAEQRKAQEFNEQQQHKKKNSVW